jgi:hypothetical protein
MHPPNKSLKLKLALLILQALYTFNQLSVYIPWSSLSHRGTLKFVTEAFHFIIVAPFLKFDISTMCHYRIMKPKVSERPIIRVHISMYIYIYMAVILKFIYIFSKILSFWFHSHAFHFEYMINKVCLTHSHSLYTVLPGVWCLEMKHHRS